MKYDSKVPAQLKATQQWFGSIICRPIDDDSQMNPISPSGHPMAEEAADYISPSPNLRPAQRIQLYNQQYWWRLLSTLQEMFPLLTRLFSNHDFNKTIAVPFLVKCPPRHWSLSLIGDRLAPWIEKEYHCSDKNLVLNCARIDWAFNHSFISTQLAPISLEHLPKNGDISPLLKKKIYLQPHLHLFELDCDLFTFRVEFLKQAPDYWLENDFPELKHDKLQYFYLCRTLNNNISWNEITPGEYHLLRLFQKGSTIEKACDWLEKQDATLCESALKNLHIWFQEWTMRQWLSLEKPETKV